MLSKPLNQPCLDTNPLGFSIISLWTPYFDLADLSLVSILQLNELWPQIDKLLFSDLFLTYFSMGSVGKLKPMVHIWPSVFEQPMS